MTWLSYRTRRVLRWTVAMLVWCSFAPQRIAAAADAPDVPRLAGTWKLDAGKSESAIKKIEASRGRSTWGHQRTVGGPRVGRDSVNMVAPREATQGARPDAPPPGVRTPELRLMTRPPDTLVIEQTDSTVVLFARGAPLEVLVIGLPQDKAGSVAPEAVHIPATWSDGRLLALRQDDRRARASQKFELSADGRTLTLTVAREPYEDGVPPLELRRVYVRESTD
ncbi:MAG TPA: hypothetical protein VJY35_07590 [Candidatus Eisenbacteria bacterium]|nr:hypothetical protein [Candidatus Eisenbacteria bacterium]